MVPHDAYEQTAFVRIIGLDCDLPIRRFSPEIHSSASCDQPMARWIRKYRFLKYRFLQKTMYPLSSDVERNGCC